MLLSRSTAVPSPIHIARCGYEWRALLGNDEAASFHRGFSDIQSLLIARGRLWRAPFIVSESIAALSQRNQRHRNPDAINHRSALASAGPTNHNTRRPSTVPACRRCRQQKKRCTRTSEGPCKPCLVAWLPCSLMERSVSPQTRERELNARIDWLSQLVNHVLPVDLPPVESIETGRDLLLPKSPREPSPVGVTADMNQTDTVHENRSSSAKSEGDKTISVSASRKCLQAYFRHVHRAYPFLDSEAIMGEFDNVCTENAGDDSLPRSLVPSRLHMIMAIGFTTLQRAGEVQDIEESSFEPLLNQILYECLCRVDKQSAGTLLLLGLYLLFKPSDMDPRAIAGVLTRHALTIGLINESAINADLSPRALELRRRLSWSIYVFDRMISISYGIPFGFPDEEMQVPLPSIMIHEYASPEGHQYTIALQVSRHVISLRQLETCIVDTIYKHDTAAHHQELRRRIEDWYTQGCLLSSSALWEDDQLPFHTTITWLNVRYQNLLLLLYSPSAQVKPADHDHIPKLQAAAQQYVQLSLILHEHRHLPMNWITLCRLLSLGAIFFYCISTWTAPSQDVPEIALLASLLEIFPATWNAAQDGSRVLHRLAETITKQKTPIMSLNESSGPSIIATAGLDVELGLQSIQSDLAALLSCTLGEASFYIWPLRSNIVGRTFPNHLVTMDNMARVPESALFGPRIGIPSNDNLTTLTPADNALGNSSLDTQWMNLLGGMGSDML